MLGRTRIALAVAREPTLARIQLAFLFFNMAEHATWVAILVYAYEVGGAAVAGIVATVQLVPSGVFAPFAAMAADRYRRQLVLLGGYVAFAAALGATALALYADAPFVLTVAVAAVAATLLVIIRPTQAAILPVVTHTPEELTAGNAVSGLAENVGVLVGPLVGGFLLLGNEPGDVFAAFAAVTAGCAALVVRLHVHEVGVSTSDRSAAALARELVGGFSAVARSRQVLVLVALLASTFVVVGALDILVVAVAIDLLQTGPSWAGFLYAAMGLGGILGAVASVALIGRRRLTPALATSSVVVGAPLAGLAVVATPISAPILLGASGAGRSVGSVAGRTLLQRVAPDAVLARIFGVLEGFSMFALAAGSVGSAAVIETVGIPGALLATGAFVPVILAAAWIELRAIDRDAPEPDPEALALLLGSPIFAPLSAPAMERVMASLVRLDVPAGATVIREGEVGDRFYLLAEGAVEISVAGRLINRQEAPSSFGEIALLRDVARTATVTAATPVRLMALDQAPFLEAVTGHPQSRRQADAVVEERLAASLDPLAGAEDEPPN